MKSIVTIGGGTGQFTLLSGLKKYPVRLTAIVSMADNGGSTGILRDELGVLPPGDVRQCLVALSGADHLMRELFNYRFESGGLRGHSFGNIFLSALEKVTGSFEKGLEISADVLAIRGSVIPVTTRNVALICGRGKSMRVGQDAVSTMKITDRNSLRLRPSARANPRALTAIRKADLIVIGPGDLYCSILPNLLVAGIPQAIRRSRAKVIYNCNLVTRRGHTDGFTVANFVDEIERYIGKGRINYVTYNTRLPDPKLARRYAAEGEPVSAESDSLDRPGLIAVGADLLSRRVVRQKSHDLLKRSLIRHDSDHLAELIVRLGK